MTDGTIMLDRAWAQGPAGEPDRAQAPAGKPEESASADLAADAKSPPPTELSAQAAKAEASAKADELVDVEFGGKAYRLPKELKSAFLMQVDYTRKTQDLAQQRRALESHRQAFLQQADLRQSHIGAVARIMAIDEQLAAAEKVDWPKLEVEKPAEAQAKLREYLMLRSQRDQLLVQVREAEQKRATEAQQDFAKRQAETHAELARDISGWDEVAPKVEAFGRQSGVTPDHLAVIATTPALAKLLHMAWVGDQLIRKQQAVAEKAEADASPPAEPLRQVAKGRGSPATSGLSDSLSVEEWVRRRNEEVRGSASLNLRPGRVRP